MQTQHLMNDYKLIAQKICAQMKVETREVSSSFVPFDFSRCKKEKKYM